MRGIEKGSPCSRPANSEVSYFVDFDTSRTIGLTCGLPPAHDGTMVRQTYWAILRIVGAEVYFTVM